METRIAATRFSCHPLNYTAQSTAGLRGLTDWEYGEIASILERLALPTRSGPIAKILSDRGMTWEAIDRPTALKVLSFATREIRRKPEGWEPAIGLVTVVARHECGDRWLNIWDYPPLADYLANRPPIRTLAGLADLIEVASNG